MISSPTRKSRIIVRMHFTVCMGCLIFSGFANIWICVMERLDRSRTCSTPEQNVGGSCSCKARFLHFFQPGSKKDMRGSGESTRAVDEKR